MRKLLALLALALLAAIPARAQVGNTTTILFAGAPSGTCAPLSFAINVSNGDLYDCVAGSWVKVGTGGGGGTIGGSIASGQIAFGAAPDEIAGSDNLNYDSGDNTVRMTKAMAQGGPMMDLNNAAAAGNCHGQLCVRGEGSDFNLVALDTNAGNNLFSFHTQPFDADHNWTVFLNFLSNSLHFLGTNDNVSFTGMAIAPIVNEVIFGDGTTATATVRSGKYSTGLNCTEAGVDPDCTSAPEGIVVIPAGSTTVTIATTAVTDLSNIEVWNAPYGSTRLGITCNATAQVPIVADPPVDATSFTVSVPVMPAVNGQCIGWRLTN